MNKFYYVNTYRVDPARVLEAGIKTKSYVVLHSIPLPPDPQLACVNLAVNMDILTEGFSESFLYDEVRYYGDIPAEALSMWVG
jgi:hypothetical protein